MKNQALFSSEDKSKKLKCRLLQFLFGALRVNVAMNSNSHLYFNSFFLKQLLISPRKFSGTRKFTLRYQ